MTPEEALRDLLDQLEFSGIYIPGQDKGQWADAAGISFREAEAALKGVKLWLFQ